MVVQNQTKEGKWLRFGRIMAENAAKGADVAITSNQVVVFSRQGVDLTQGWNDLKDRSEVWGGWIDKRDDEKEEDGEVIMVKDDAFLESVTFFVFVFEKEGFKFGVTIIMKFDAGGNEVDSEWDWHESAELIKFVQIKFIENFKERSLKGLFFNGNKLNLDNLKLRYQLWRVDSHFTHFCFSQRALFWGDLPPEGILSEHVFSFFRFTLTEP